MAEAKTKQNNASVSGFLGKIGDKQQRADAKKLAAMMRAATGSRAKMWGSAIIGFGSYHYKYASGREGDWPIVGFSPRKANLSVYIMPGFSKFDALMSKLGKYKTGKSCLYIRRLSDVDEKILQRLINESVKHMRKHYETRK
ncbi:MAG: DUF1801 domain-containing protein [Gammaproteobacteria bacterium]|nr:DUF1801 domain-containing protein [Gammaproteobacteria bacterium]